MLIDHPFFGMLAMHMDFIPNENIETARTNGQWVEYCPKFFEGLTPDERIGVVAHEVMHPALQHLFRCEGRDPRTWNEAADYALNPLLVSAGMKLPKGVLLDAKYDNMFAEQIYSLLKLQKQKDQKQGKGQGEGKAGKPGNDAGQPASGAGKGGQIMPGCPTGDFVDAPADGNGDKMQLGPEDWKIILAQAESVSRKAGNMPGCFSEQIKASREGVVDWRGLLSSFVTNTVPSELSWSRPNRRFISQGIYIPGVKKENVGEIVCWVDSSGSCSTEMQKDFAAELTHILHTTKPEKLWVVYVDTKVQKVCEYGPDDTEIEIDVPGRGGTHFQPAFDWVKEKGISPLCGLYLTDLANGDQPTAPDFPIMWITPEHISGVGLFGAPTVRIPA
jgi:predicted metal-dependent peptidase